jgi:hypothetical protein
MPNRSKPVGIMPRYFLIPVLLLALLWVSPAAASEIIGGACTGSGSSASLAQAVDGTYDGNNTVCNGSVWQFPAYQFGSTAASCNGTNAGIVQWTGSVFQGCNGSSWSSLTVGYGLALSALTAATTTNSIDSTNNAQTWAWGTLSTETAMTLTTSSITTGTLLNLSGTATAAGAGTVLKVTTSEAGASYAIQAINGGLANTGYAGYFSNSATTAGYGVYATNASTGAGYGVYGSITGTNNTGYGVYALNNSASGWGIYAGGTSQNYFAGNVAIGSNNNPTTTLLVTAPGSAGDIDVAHFSAAGDTSAGVNLTIDNSNTLNADRQAQFVLAANGTGRWYIGSDYDNSGSQTFYIYDRPSTAFRFFIDSTGQVGIGNTSPGALLDVGLAGTTTGSLRLEGGTSGYVQIQPAGAAGSWAITLPGTAGTSGYVLSTNGSGVTSWVANGAGSTPALSSITSATTTNSIDSRN